jgi:hypothetical protein
MEQEKTSLEKIDNAYVRKNILDAINSIEFYVSDCYGQLVTMQEVKDFNDAVCAIVFAYRHVREAELEVDAAKKKYGCTEPLEDKDAETVSGEIPTDARV